jgi:hypothetical protein
MDDTPRPDPTVPLTYASPGVQPTMLACLARQLSIRSIWLALLAAAIAFLGAYAVLVHSGVLPEGLLILWMTLRAAGYSLPVPCIAGVVVAVWLEMHGTPVRRVLPTMAAATVAQMFVVLAMFYWQGLSGLLPGSAALTYGIHLVCWSVMVRQFSGRAAMAATITAVVSSLSALMGFGTVFIPVGGPGSI